MSIQALRERLAAISRDMNGLLASQGDKVWDKETQGKFDALGDELERGRTQLAAMENSLQAGREDNFTDVEDFRLSPQDRADQAKMKAKKREVVRGMELFLRKSDRQLSQEEAQIIRNTMSTTTGSEGGFTVDPILSSDFIEKMKDYGGMRRVGTTIKTANGVDMSYPTTDGTAEEGEIIAQNTTATDLDITFGTVGLNVFKYSSKVVTIPFELLQDTSIDILALIYSRLRMRLGRVQNRHFTVGVGTTEPLGLVTAATVGKTGTTGQTTSVIYDDLVDVIDSVDLAYLNGGAAPKWMFNQATRRVIRKIKDTAGRPIWTPSYDGGISGKFSDQLLGFDVELNNHMASMAANAKPIAFGKLDEYIMRDAMEMQFFRFDDSAYTKKGQVGFMAWMRSGGNLTDTNGVRLYQNSAT